MENNEIVERRKKVQIARERLHNLTLQISTESKNDNEKIFKNIKGNTFKPKYYHEPKTTLEIQNLISLSKKNKQKIKIIGNGHSSNSIFHTNDHLVSLCNFKEIIYIRYDEKIIKVGAGITLRELNVYLEKINFSLINQPEFDNITLGGALSTSIHGFGMRDDNLAMSVTELDVITANGEFMTIEKDSDLFKAFQCSLGCLGVIINVTLKINDIYSIETTEEMMEYQNFMENYDIQDVYKNGII
jgi:L-gulonolactone oxidase